jgi:tRNA-binding protein
MSEISYDDFKKLKMCVGFVTKAERVPKTEKLFKLQVDVGVEKPIQIVTSLVDHYSDKELAGKRIIVLLNLKPSLFKGELSSGMLLCAETEDHKKCVLLTVDKDIPSGTPVA